MLLGKAESGRGKGWVAGPWNGNAPVAIGFADIGGDEPHTHDRMFEIYLVARGTSTAMVGAETVELEAGSVLIVEPGEVHRFTRSSSDYLHFVVQAPFTEGDKRFTE